MLSCKSSSSPDEIKMVEEWASERCSLSLHNNRHDVVVAADGVRDDRLRIGFEEGLVQLT